MAVYFMQISFGWIEHQPFMTRHNKDRTGRMSHNVFCGAPDQDMFEAGCSVCGSHNRVRMVVDGSRANLLTGVPDLQ